MQIKTPEAKLVLVCSVEVFMFLCMIFSVQCSHLRLCWAMCEVVFKDELNCRSMYAATTPHSFLATFVPAQTP